MNTQIEHIKSAGERWVSRTKTRQQSLQALRNGKLSTIDTQERIQKRLKHLASSQVTEFKKSLENAESSLVDSIGLERVIKDDDFLGIEFLELALAMSRSVCRVNIFSAPGRLAGYGTGFMVSPSLMMTNNHVLENSAMAGFSNVIFDYQLDAGKNMLPIVQYELEPIRFFMTDKALDFSIVAVKALSNTNIPLSNYGWNRLMGEGKAMIGDPLNIIQHPSGEVKQIVLQSNELIDLLPKHAHYLTDTQPGSSGSPAYNNQWEVVALHHAGVPKIVNGNCIDIDGNKWNGSDPSKLAWVANEGIRISQIIEHLKNQSLSMEWQSLRDEMLEAKPPNPIELYDKVRKRTQPYSVPAPNPNSPSGIEYTIPLKITISLDGLTPPIIPGDNLSLSASDRVALGSDRSFDLERTVVPYMDPDYTTRNGYNERFLGKKIALPKILKPGKTSKMDNGEYVIPYHHFSVVMNKERRLAYYCASNIDANIQKKEPEPGRKYSRKGLAGMRDNDREAWLTDPRIPEYHQLPDKFYNRDRQSFDKGHIVRREDVAWGNTYEEVRIANGDTFHTTNCSPQVANFNRSNRRGIWGKFENHVLREAETDKLCVFSGPVFEDDDPEFDGFDNRGRIKIQIPKAFWKVIVCVSGSEIKTYAFVFEQDLSAVDMEEEFSVGRNYKNYQEKLSTIESRLDNIQFPKILKNNDQYR